MEAFEANFSRKSPARAQKVSLTGTWKYDIRKDRFGVSEEAGRILGINRDHFKGNLESFISLIHPDDKKLMEKLFQNPTKEAADLEFRIIRTDSSVRYIYQKAEFQFESNGKPTKLLGTIQDITDKKFFEIAILEKQLEINKIQRKYQILIKESSDVFMIVSPDGTINYISEASERIIGYRPEELMGKNISDIHIGLKNFFNKMSFVLKDYGNKYRGEITITTKSGKDIYTEYQLQNLLHTPEIEGIVVNFRDITSRIELQSKVEYISTHDDLTGLPNRYYLKIQLWNEIQKAKKESTKFALYMLDINGLKYVNYSFGYELGNKLIINAVNRMEELLGNEAFICRYSENIFTIIVKGTGIRDFEELAGKLLNNLKEPYRVDNFSLDVYCNIGISIYPDNSKDIEQLKKQAIVTLLRASKDGRNKYKFHSPDLDIQTYKEFVLRNDLHSAIEDGQLRVYYQPLVCLKTNEIIAAEALIRWEHPEWGIITPDEFISLAEETGLIINIGNWMLREVCQNYRKWLDKGYPEVKISVNLSGIQLFENDFTENIINTIKEFNLSPYFLILEITESILIKNDNRAISIIQKLQSYGIKVALDDFGTGFSSLAYLNSYKIDILKIDQSFVKNIIKENRSAVITKTVINMARELNIKLVAEGIDNWRQLILLKDLDCYTGQGYLYSRPVTQNIFESLLIKKICTPSTTNVVEPDSQRNKRKYCRVKLERLLEVDIAIKEIQGKKINVGNTKVLVKDFGPGGLCFISDIRLPVKKSIIFEFATILADKEIKVDGFSVWREKMDYKLYEYGVEFVFNDYEKSYLYNCLTELKQKIRSNTFSDNGNFIAVSPEEYFELHTN